MRACPFCSFRISPENPVAHECIQRMRFTEALDDLVPRGLHLGLLRYLDHGLEPGSFLYSVLCNDLTLAVHAADEISLRALPSIVRFMGSEMPVKTWGSSERVRDWVRSHYENTDGLSAEKE